MKKFIVLAMALGLAACGATPEEEKYSIMAAQSSLPEGCQLTYAGSVKVAGEHYESRVFYVKCGDVTTVSENHVVQTGKTSHNETDVTITR